MRPIRGGYLSFYNRKGLRGISFFVMAAPPFTVTVSGILRSSLSAYNSVLVQCGRAFIVICLIFNFFVENLFLRNTLIVWSVSLQWNRTRYR